MILRMLVLWYFVRERLFDVERDFLCNFCVNISRFEEFDKPTYLGFFNAQYDGHQMTFSWLETLFKINNLGIMYQDSIYHNICISNCLSHFKPLLLWWHRCISMWWYCIGKWALVIYLSVKCAVGLIIFIFIYIDNPLKS